VGTPYIIGSVAEYFNTAAFALQPLGQFGNEGINVVQGPGISNDFNMNLYRNFAIREHAKFRIGAEFFNVFNHANFTAFGTTFGSATYGKLTAALDPRNIQFSARLSF